ncbi:hypothetical protein E2C01_010714 [Portunus trituberculatus]|uniref:Uncharacterized protein n=1 Tax=Portunus trituberculatus TaxID=210409 RepID=A0A5B7D9E7_PORTR|nr:hypothetical protein [Portunus trituberculatus]
MAACYNEAHFYREGGSGVVRGWGERALYHDSSGPMVVKSVAFVHPNLSRSIKKMFYFHHST